MNPKPIILVLDFDCAAKADLLISQLEPSLCRLKVGKQLFTAAGPQYVDRLIARGFEVFLDLKYHDIPNTVAAACRVAANQGVWMLNVHASGGAKMLQAAREAVDKASHRPLLIAVTILTSMAQPDIAEVGFHGDVQSNVMRLASLAHTANFDGIVCSAEEATLMKSTFGKSFACVTPGIRLPEDEKGDQSRVVTPTEAIKMGADYLVIGRTIAASNDPLATLHKINTLLQKDARAL